MIERGEKVVALVGAELQRGVFGGVVGQGRVRVVFEELMRAGGSRYRGTVLPWWMVRRAEVDHG